MYSSVSFASAIGESFVSSDDFKTGFLQHSYRPDVVRCYAGENRPEGLGVGFMADRFDVVPVRANDESCIVVRVIFRADTRRTIVFATRFHSRAIESVDLLAILGLERQVKRGRRLSVRYRHNEALPFELSSTPNVGVPSWTTATPSGSSALRKNALLAA